VAHTPDKVPYFTTRRHRRAASAGTVRPRAFAVLRLMTSSHTPVTLPLASGKMGRPPGEKREPSPFERTSIEGGRPVRTLIGMTICLVIGLVAGLAVMNFWREDRRVTLNRDDGGATVLPKSNKQVSNLTESFYVCRPDLKQDKESSLLIKSDSSGAREMVFPWKSDADVLTLEETTDLYYRANAKNSEVSEAYSSIDLNRVSGELFITSRISNDVVKLLVSICDRRAPLSECRSRMENIRGGSLTDCLSVVDDIACSRVRSGTNISGRFRYQCRSVERRF
jgi:hypothetical protein